MDAYEFRQFMSHYNRPNCPGVVSAHRTYLASRPKGVFPISLKDAKRGLNTLNAMVLANSVEEVPSESRVAAFLAGAGALIVDVSPSVGYRASAFGYSATSTANPLSAVQHWCRKIKSMADPRL